METAIMFVMGLAFWGFGYYILKLHKMEVIRLLIGIACLSMGSSLFGPGYDAIFKFIAGM